MSAHETRDHRVCRALERLADTTVVGLLALVVSLPAALAAAHTTLSDQERGGSVVGRFRNALGATWRVGTLLGTFALVLVLIGVIDVLWALGSPLTLVRTAVLAAGILLVLGASAVTVTGCAQLAAEARNRDAGSGRDVGGPERSVRCPHQSSHLLRGSAVIAASAPHRVLPLVVLGAFGIAVVVAVPVLAPLVLGAAAWCLHWVPVPAVQRPQRFVVGV